MNWRSLLSHKSPLDFDDSQPQRVVNETTFVNRSAFDIDYDRIIFSHAFRKMQDKTQVFPLPKESFVHSRLTHSLEVSSVGRSLGRKIGAILEQQSPEHINANALNIGSIVAAAAIAHDIGNPPFGHSGEQVISEYFKFHKQAPSIEKKLTAGQWQDLLNFEGNAQGFRLLCDKNAGLKISAATLATFSKYPGSSSLMQKNGRKSQKKYGYFQSEKSYFDNLSKQCGLIPLDHNKQQFARHPLTFLMEAADDICYNIIDLEDAHRLGILSFDEVKNLLIPILGDRYKPQKLDRITHNREKISVLRAMTIAILIEECSEAFVRNQEALLTGSFDDALIDTILYHNEMKAINKISIEKIYHNPTVIKREIQGHTVLSALMDAFGSALLKEHTQRNSKEKHLVKMVEEEVTINRQSNDQPLYQRIRMLTDYISGLTDRQCLRLYNLLG